jgi:dimethylhistidine N-methyltransferase
MTNERFRIVDGGALTSDKGRSIFAEDVRAGLLAAKKELSCRYFYDDAGSRLFERICELPEYYLPHAEREILERNAPRIAELLAPGAALIELGSGNAAKTTLIIAEILRRQGSLLYIPLDVSRTILEESSARLLASFGTLVIEAIVAEYDRGLGMLRHRASDPKLILWLGSNIGNFDRRGAADFLLRVRRVMSPGDRLLVGIDLRKGRTLVEPAYDDAAGVTAEFNKNILARINRELGADFDLRHFRHRAVYDEVSGRIEMYLVSDRMQWVTVQRLGLSVRFAEGEAIHTEDSYKYGSEEITELAERAGMVIEARYVDSRSRFVDCVLRRG